MNKTCVRWGAVVLAVGFACGIPAACGDDDSGSSPAVQQCNAMVTAICNRMIVCAAVPDMAQCHAAVDPYLPCRNARGIGPTYSTCMADVPAIDCALLGGPDWLPASCRSVILMNP